MSKSDPDFVFSTILERASHYLEEDGLLVLRHAYEIALQSHGAQKRDSGEEYIHHPLEVMSYLVEMRMDAPTLAAALLHDVPEDTQTGLEVITAEFGKEISRLVDGVTKLGKLKPPQGALDDIQSVFGQADTFDKMMSAAADDIRVILIKLADRYHNMTTIQALPLPRRRKVVASTVLIYIPMAARLGIWFLKSRMDDLALQAIDPETYAEVSFILESRRSTHQAAFSSIKRLVQHRLIDLDISADVNELPESASEVFKFSQESGIGIDKIQDSVRISVVVPRSLDCYTAIGVIHSLWKPIPGKIDDYIVSPKENLYRSLHTTCVGPGGLMIKFRIRTPDMDDWANYGIYAYWRSFDSRKGPGQPGHGKPEDRIAWLNRMSEWREELRDFRSGDHIDETSLVHEFVESLLSDFLPEHIDVFTPKGDVIELPVGATALDFAYKIHTDLGHSCRAVRVNDRSQPVNKPLINGDQVLILRISQPEPQYEWLNPELGYIRTSLARQSIKRWFRRQEKHVQIERGKQELEFEFSLLGINGLDFTALSEMMEIVPVQLFLSRIGSADLNASEVVKTYLEQEFGLTTSRIGTGDSKYTIDGVGTLQIREAKCCNPHPGNSIVGVVTSSEHITVHRLECQYALKAIGAGKIIALNWKETARSIRPVTILIDAFDRKELLNHFSSIVGAERVNMSRVIATTDKSTNQAKIEALVDIESSNQLLRILHQTVHMPNVIKVETIFMTGEEMTGGFHESQDSSNLFLPG